MRVLAVVTAAAALAAAPAAATTAARPSLALVDRTPVTFAGRGFKGGEGVRVTVSVDGRTHTKRVVASPSGAFTARYTVWAAEDACTTALAANAIGSRGSRAAYKLPQRACPIPN